MKRTMIGLTALMMAGMVQANPTIDSLREHVAHVSVKYIDGINTDTVRDTVYACAYLGYERDRTVAVNQMSDEQQHTELARQGTRCACYFDFILDTYSESLPTEARTRDTLKELIMSSLFVELEHDRIFEEFKSQSNFTETMKYQIAYNTANHCHKE